MNGTPHASTEYWRGIMHLYGTGVFKQQGDRKPGSQRQAGTRLRAAAAVMLALVTGVPSGWAQQPTSATPDKAASSKSNPNKAASDLPPAPVPTVTDPLYLRSSS